MPIERSGLLVLLVALLYLVGLNGGDFLVQGNIVANLYLKWKFGSQAKQKHRRESLCCLCLRTTRIVNKLLPVRVNLPCHFILLSIYNHPRPVSIRILPFVPFGQTTAKRKVQSCRSGMSCPQENKSDKIIKSENKKVNRQHRPLLCEFCPDRCAKRRAKDGVCANVFERTLVPLLQGSLRDRVSHVGDLDDVVSY